MKSASFQQHFQTMILNLRILTKSFYLLLISVNDVNGNDNVATCRYLIKMSFNIKTKKDGSRQIWNIEQKDLPVIAFQK